ncbi:MAG TPA: hypothetical protein VFF07_11660 [Actinomycetota bacterium]|nr:hypothetical protein [Actinomycetota bacterium]
MARTRVLLIRGEESIHEPLVVMLTARGEEMDLVLGFELGAHD